jgi:hypothetical protein
MRILAAFGKKESIGEIKTLRGIALRILLIQLFVMNNQKNKRHQKR